MNRSQITLNEIIGVGQFGDVHIGTCIISKAQRKATNSTENIDSSQKDEDDQSTGENNGEKYVIHVAVKTCKADADLVTSEKFLEEACE